MPTKRTPTRKGYRKESAVTNERWAQFLAGEITVHDMDDQELARGQFKNSAGDFRGRPPNTVPRDFATQLSRELMSRADSRFRDRLLEAIDKVAEVMRNGEKDADQLRAANLVIERLMGKVPERVVVSPGRPDWEDAVDELLGTGLEDDAIHRAREVLGR